MNLLRSFGGIVLGMVMLSTAFVGIASAQQCPTVSNLTRFSAQTGYVRCPVISSTAPISRACSGLRIRKPLVSSGNRGNRWAVLGAGRASTTLEGDGLTLGWPT